MCVNRLGNKKQYAKLLHSYFPLTGGGLPCSLALAVNFSTRQKQNLIH